MEYVREVLSACKGVHTIFIFLSKDDEINTTPIITSLLASGKRVVAPRTENDGTITPLLLQSLSYVRSGKHGIREPIGDGVSVQTIDLFIVPGVQFDKKGNRKGRGSGCFDRFLADIKGIKPIIGLCYTDQLVEQLTPQPWDVAVDRVITGRK
jgi:5-formyltetrahydrofolate cyclo-ligase